jgi:hypothetical protein
VREKGVGERGGRDAKVRERSEKDCAFKRKKWGKRKSILRSKERQEVTDR